MVAFAFYEGSNFRALIHVDKDDLKRIHVFIERFIESGSEDCIVLKNGVPYRWSKDGVK